jgi:hypothetical protein
VDRFRADALRPLPVIPYDYRDTAEALVHKDLRLQFDGNRYCVPHRFVGSRLTLKADSSCLSIDIDASLNTDHEPRRLKIPRGSALVCLGVEFGAPHGSSRASKPARVLLF